MPEEDGSLSALARRLQALVLPSLTALIARLWREEDYQQFLSMVKELLPEREAEILRNLTPATQVAAFASYFEDRYFPLQDHFREPESGMVESYSDFTRSIPIILRSISYEDYHDLASGNFRDGTLVSTLLIEDPYSGDGDTHIAIAEACLQLVPAELIQLVPEGGISPEEAHQLLNDTEYEGLALWADQLHLSTNNIFFDTDYEMFWGGYDQLDWDLEIVERLTREWQQADVIDEKVGRFFDWLEGDLEPRFRELLNFILERRGNA